MLPLLNKVDLFYLFRISNVERFMCGDKKRNMINDCRSDKKEKVVALTMSQEWDIELSSNGMKAT